MDVFKTSVNQIVCFKDKSHKYSDNISEVKEVESLCLLSCIIPSKFVPKYEPPSPHTPLLPLLNPPLLLLTVFPNSMEYFLISLLKTFWFLPTVYSSLKISDLHNFKTVRYISINAYSIVFLHLKTEMLFGSS